MNCLRSPSYLPDGPGQLRRCAEPGVAQGREAAGVNGLGHQRAGHAQVEGQLAHPLARALGPGRVHDGVDQVSARLGIADAEDIAGDLDEVAVQLAVVPIVEDLVEFVVGQAQGVLEDPVGLADQLHVAVLDAVVDHLHVMAGAAGADPFAAGNVVVRPDLGRDRLEDRLDQRPGLFAAAGHDAGPLQRAFLAAGDAGADEQQALRFDILRAAFGVVKIGVAAVDDHVAGREQRNEVLDELIDRRAGLDHEHHLARRGQASRPVLPGCGSRGSVCPWPGR